MQYDNKAIDYELSYRVDVELSSETCVPKSFAGLYAAENHDGENRLHWKSALYAKIRHERDH